MMRTIPMMIILAIVAMMAMVAMMIIMANGNDASDDNHGNGGNRKEVEVGWISTRNANCGFAWSSTQPN